jgi:DNA mismatch repair protein MutL
MASTAATPFEADLVDSLVPPPAESPAPENLTQAASPSSEVSQANPKSFRKAVQIHDSYLVVETDEGLSLVDQHALHERILYEELRTRVQEGGIESQRLLLPEVLELEPADHDLALEHSETLGKLGLEVQDYGAPTLAVLSIPTMARHVAAGDLVRDLIDRFRHSQADPEPEALLNLTLATIACKAAVKAGDPLEPEEIEALLSKATHFAHSHHCPHGRPSSLNFSKSELEKRFGRI